MTKSGSDLVAEAKARVKEIDAANAIMEKQKPDTVFLDVREPNEWNLGHVPGAIHIPRGQLEGKVEGVLDRDKNIVVYCAGGSRSALAADTLQQMGYQHVASLKGGFRGWAEGGGEIED
ncbi:MAG TPA: rhodanese-like domain-containing protein [Gemmatimonadaceae bacterium]|jgi:sulfur-carrier protein adenylyltransferase/sulfurtransferase|nr:rhodanese-like domain-containing protein [Gemmatimonadaceae bacterium]